MPKTLKEINEKIKEGKAVVVTAEEIISIVQKKGLEKAAEEVDVVTTATFGPMCSSGAYLNIGHSNPKIRITEATLNDVPVYSGVAAIDMFLGATQLQKNDPGNKKHPGEFSYGGAHVIHELIKGDDIDLIASSYGTDEYPRKNLRTKINIKDINECNLLNFRNCYQNYNVAVNASDKTIYTYLGVLKPNIGNANYCSAGQLSPLLNDPDFETIGIGTKIFLGGAEGFVIWNGTQHDPSGIKIDENGNLIGGGGTLSVIGDMKKMSPKYIVPLSLRGYGVSLAVGIGVPIPILNKEILKRTTIRDEQIFAPIVDYSNEYPNNLPNSLGYVSYKDLKSGEIKVKGKKVKTGALSSYPKALEIAKKLKNKIKEGNFFLSETVQKLPQKESGYECKKLNFRPIENGNQKSIA